MSRQWKKRQKERRKGGAVILWGRLQIGLEVSSSARPALCAYLGACQCHLRIVVFVCFQNNKSKQPKIQHRNTYNVPFCLNEGLAITGQVASSSAELRHPMTIRSVRSVVCRR
jgi:hypothetical protein